MNSVVVAMARMDRRSRKRIGLVVTAAVVCFFLVQLYSYFYRESIEGKRPVSDRGAGNERKVRPINRQHYQHKTPKTPQQIESFKSSRLDFVKAQTAVQAKRKALLRKVCERREVRSSAVPSLYTRRHIYVVDKHKVMYCFIPKVGCSNWKRILMVLNGDKDSVEGLTSEEIHLKAELRFLSSYTPGQQDYRLMHYRKFVFVREPFKRALSVYRNKFEDLTYYRGNKYFHKFGKQIVSKFKKNAPSSVLKTGENATWSEFVDYLTHPTERAEVETDVHFSDHWAEMHRICSPCTIDYDVIGHLETVENDAKFVLDLLQAPNKVRYLSSANSRPTNSSDSKTYNRYFSQLTPLQLTKLWDLYKLDYELFGYPKPKVVPG